MSQEDVKVVRELTRLTAEDRVAPGTTRGVRSGRSNGSEKMAGFSGFANKAKDVFQRRGGTQAAKEDLQELKEVKAGGGTMTDKAKKAAEALKDPGAKGPGQ
jgi:hypothetical protein